MDACPLHDDPKACFTAFQSRLTKLKHPWDYVECLHCKSARVNAIIAVPPEPDREPEHYVYDIDPDDFLPTPPKKRGRSSQTLCRRGHPYIIKSGKKRCRVCERLLYAKKMGRG